MARRAASSAVSRSKAKSCVRFCIPSRNLTLKHRSGISKPPERFALARQDPLTPALSPRGEGAGCGPSSREEVHSGVPSPLGERDRVRGSSPCHPPDFGLLIPERCLTQYGECGVECKSEEYNGAETVVAAEAVQAVLRIFDIERGDLPDGMRRSQGQP